ncbi:shufflon system plasmid conjugative transfer pilus tip adhesin PilV [Pectobacterium odoriferum]|uniref:shufflon system plasmid conjugative transfer pilus tip adhesin PilV n=1 Tax=Pectobacterium odoriferum TaxID=78398 RepID=UPI00298F9B56|nr:shufflon system plasmid conjugative transfer pilus tip adhesin PilV [Pectobacterium odoriferum]
MKKQFKKGFSLLELVLVLGVGATMGLIKFQDMKSEQENILASTVGQQMKQMGEAVNGYINIRYDKLSTLSNAAGNGSDPGPRTCSGSVCEITYTTLINEGLLPSTFSGLNAQKSTYKIILKRDGISPNYVVNGLITTTIPWKEGVKIRYDLLGKAMLSAGIDSGMTKSATVASGYEGQWSEKTSDFRNISSEGLLAYRTGFNSVMYTVYLRRDGTLPMTGDLNMGGKSIANAKKITASGTGDFGGSISSEGNITAKKEVIVHNGYGDTIKLGGDAAGNDYELYLSANKPLSLWSSLTGGSPTDTNKSNTLLKVAGAISSGDINSIGNITSSGNLVSKGNVSAAGVLQLGQINITGAVCENNGDISRDKVGDILSCVNGKWASPASDGVPVGIPHPWPSTTLPSGWLVANGQSFNKVSYPKLALVYPSGKLPDLRGLFIRGSDQGRGYDVGRQTLTEQEDAIRNITGTFQTFDSNSYSPTGTFKHESREGSSVSGKPQPWQHSIIKMDASKVVPTADENRPKNMSFIYIIKAE